MKTNDKINWKNCNLNGAILHSIYLDNANLTEVDFSDGKFVKVHFEKSNLYCEYAAMVLK